MACNPGIGGKCKMKSKQFATKLYFLCSLEVVFLGRTSPLQGLCFLVAKEKVLEPEYGPV